MFIIREASTNDIEDLYSLSKKALLINLPRNRDLIEKKVLESIKSFNSPNKTDLSENHFIFVLEDTETSKVLGVSMIHGKHGTQEVPHFYLRVGKEEKHSDSLNQDFTHQTLKFGHTTDGYTEIGGLILDPSLRGHPLKLGKQLSIARFLFIAQNQDLFTEEIHSELVPPLSPDGSSLLWEAIGRKFFNMEYWEADKLSQTNKEFIMNLFPQGTIYTKLLPQGAIKLIGEVGNDTLPVKKMLESIGFNYTNEIDPFDGGPHYRAKISDIKVVKNLFTGSLQTNNKIKGKLALAQLSSDQYKFLCVGTHLESIEKSSYQTTLDITKLNLSSQEFTGYYI